LSNLPRPGWRALLYGLVAFAVAAILLTAPPSGLASATTHSYDGPRPSFTDDLAAGNVVSVVIHESERVVQVTDRGGQAYSVNYPDTVQLTELLAKYPQVSVTSTAPSAQWWRQALIVVVPFVGIFCLFALVVSRRRLRQGG
jgi:ATP-dependent Zn protease